MSNYKDGITVITPHGDRNWCFKRYLYYLERQTLQPNQVLIGHDCSETNRDIISQYIQESKLSSVTKTFWRPYGNDKAKSLTGNLLSVLDAVEYNNVVIMENDDWYHSDYLKRQKLRLQNVLVAGQARTMYYNIRERCYRKNNNTDRASLCETSFVADLIIKFKKCCELKRNSAFVDSRFWKMTRERNWPHLLSEDKRYCVGLKGLPGRAGIGVGHRPGRSYVKDFDWKKLTAMIGKEDSKFYIDWWLNRDTTILH